MDFRSLVNKENFKTILHHHLKRQVHAKFSSVVSKSIQSRSENDTTSSDSIISTVSHNISQSDEYKEFTKTFLGSLNHLFEDRDKYVPKEDNQGTVSQCSSASSINTSIDYISFDQFQGIIHTLSNGVNAEKLEALETFSRLPSLEHIIKQTLWPSVEVGLHRALFSDVSLLKEATLKVYTKMLSSSEPKVVQEGFNSLIKHVVQNLLPSINQNSEFVNKCKSIVEITAIINKFLQNIPSHWLRYPQQVIEDITNQSVSILSYGSKHSKVFPIWLCVALCDKKSKWLKNILYGHVSRAYLIDALRKDSYTIKLAIQFCDTFNSNNNYLSGDKCCQKPAEIAEVTHIICFLSHLLKYSQGREIFNSIYDDESSNWLNLLELLIKCTHKLCLISCFSCCSITIKVHSKIWYHIWSDSNVSLYCDSLTKILLNYNDIKDLPTNSIYFIILCLYNIPCDFTSTIQTSYICDLLKYLNDFSFILPEISLETSMLLNSSLKYMIKILSEPSNLFIHSTFISIFPEFSKKISNLSKSLTTNFGSGLKNNLVLGVEQNICRFFIAMLQKPCSVSILHNIEFFEASANILLEKIFEDIKSKKYVCPKDVSVLSSALESKFSANFIHNKSVIFKLSSVIWLHDTNFLQNLPTIKSILGTLIPSIFPQICQSEILTDENLGSDIELFQYVTLFPSLANQELFMLDEHSLLALQIISLLTCSIFSICYLEAKYKLSEILFKHFNCDINEENVIIIDEFSVIKNHILVKLFIIGGLKEKVLPPAMIETSEYDWPFVMGYPVPECYYYKLTYDENENIEDNDYDELNNENLKDIFLKYINQNFLSINSVINFLNTSLTLIEESPMLSRTLNIIALDEVDHVVLHDEILIGLKLTKRYGEFLYLIKDEDEKNLEKLVKAGKYLLSTEERSQLDLFICTVALMFKCDIQTAWNFLEKFSKSTASLFIWHERMLQATEQNDIHITIFDTIMEHCNMIVKQTLPLIYSAFQFGKILPSSMFQYWTRHCYWNYLDFTEIAHFILASVLLGGDFAVYFFVSILKHMHSLILKNAHNFNLINLLKGSAIDGYKMCNYIDFMLELSNTYKSKISKCVTEVLNE